MQNSKLKLFTKYTLSITTMLILNSCIITNTPGFYNGYKNLSEVEKEKVVFSGANLNQLVNTGQIVVINGIQLREYAQEVDTLVVYQWSPNCSSKSCILISSCQDYCNTNNYKLAVVADYYETEKMDAQNIGELPILIADHIYYNKYFATSLKKKFYKDFFGTQYEAVKENYNRFYFFYQGKLIGSRNDLFKDKTTP